MKLLILLLLAAALQSAPVDLPLKGLSEPLQTLTNPQRKTLDRSIALIRRGEHLAALSVLQEMAKNTPGSSAVRVVLSYALVQAGNIAGAFDEARIAEGAPDHNSYVCVFLAKIALLAGDASTCRREIEHARPTGKHQKDIKEIESALAKR
jgi:Flp pilus assembly protein TadD